MNKKNIIGVALIVLTVALVALAVSTAGSGLERLIGKAVWYLPYATLVSGVGLLRPRA